MIHSLFTSAAASDLVATILVEPGDRYAPVDWDGLAGVILIGMVGLVGISAIVFGGLYSLGKRRQFEQSRREIAAYVAEGSISPEDAERILRNGPDKEQ